MDLKLVLLISTFVVASQAEFHFQFPEFPKMTFPKIEFPPFPNMVFPTFRRMEFPTPTDLTKVKPGPGEHFHGVAVSSSSTPVIDKSGRVVLKEDTTIITNTNGKVNEHKYGDGAKTASAAPVHISIPIPEQHDPPKPDPRGHAFFWPQIQVEEFKPLEMPDMDFDEMPAMKPFNFEMPQQPDFDFHMPHQPDFDFHIDPPMSAEKLKTYQPSENEHFTGHSVSSFSETTNNNGVVNSRGGVTSTVNDNGKGDEESILFQSGNDKKL